MNLVYSATSRCPCGAGLAYEVGGDGRPVGHQSGAWDCAAILLGVAIEIGELGSVQHVGKMPFVFYDIKEETQPSANGRTTRPPS